MGYRRSLSNLPRRNPERECKSYIVDKVVRHNYKNKMHSFYVYYNGYPLPSWQPLKDLITNGKCNEALITFLNRNLQIKTMIMPEIKNLLNNNHEMHTFM